MPPKLLITPGGQFKDSVTHRTVTLRGINFAGDSKTPYYPKSELNDNSCIKPGSDDAFWDDADNVSFVNKPFALEDADIHLSRIRSWGFNTIRFVFTWESLEHQGPGLYDEKYISYLIKVLDRLKYFGFYVFLNPHQDCWSRFSGGSGAPLWTFYAIGMDPKAFQDTHTAILKHYNCDIDQRDQNEDYPKMVWPTNYSKLACQTIFTLFFGGNDFAPGFELGGQTIQDYLQDKFVNAVLHLLKRIKNQAGYLLNTTIIGVENLNEPNAGYIGQPSLTKLSDSQFLRISETPTGFESMQLGMGFDQSVGLYEFASFGSKKVGDRLIKPEGANVWLSTTHYDRKYNFKRDHKSWLLDGRCIWSKLNVWDSGTRKIIRDDYFTIDPDTGIRLTELDFNKKYFMSFWGKFYSKIRKEIGDDLLIFCQPPVLSVPPMIKNTEFIDSRVVYSPHYYDGLTLVKKSWNRKWNVDTLGILRGKYLTPAFGVKFGIDAIRQSFVEQLGMIRKEGEDNFGESIPIVLSESGVPIDLDDGKSFETHNYSDQIEALDCITYALEKNLLGITYWTYTINNSHKFGDVWNGEDFSFWSKDDMKKDIKDIALSFEHDKEKPILSDIDEKMDDDESFIYYQPISSGLEPGGRRESLNSIAQKYNGLRVKEAVIRPLPIQTIGHVVEYNFCLEKLIFHLKVDSSINVEKVIPSQRNRSMIGMSQVKELESGDYFSKLDKTQATLIFLPLLHYNDTTQPNEIKVTLTSGEWKLDREKQVLYWWHESGIQAIDIACEAVDMANYEIDKVSYLPCCRIS
ncbi:glycoside hydrolase [Nadsonia fulvescens var. elongata DSM 6958]|uniref:Glycoside hydrolase n=1 Tax=Nadsonia fulvescens var. elongata DSM 6958 TaxID=857566 RepID=A0A1E3PKP1_9ASCO|nr:glycoside hydrolase [Nadsonia fulvescens var. elongata DSM 6958]